MTRYRVLIVDDTAAMRRTLERALRRAGHVAFAAASGEEACEILSTTDVDVVLTDLRMPTMSGRTLFQLIVTQWPELAQRLAVMSGDPEADEHADWLALHDLPVLPKPFRLGDVMQLVERLGARSRGTARGNEA